MTIRGAFSRLIHTIFEALPEGLRRAIVRRRAELTGLGQLKKNQEMLAMRLAELEGQGVETNHHEEVPDERFPPLVRSRLCTQAQLSEPWFRSWCEAMAEPPTAHRKTWEFAYAAEVLDQLGLLESGRRGLGFGVGREALVPLFASRGVEIVATDLEPDSREALGWTRSGQHAFGVEGLLRPEVCKPDAFRELVSWRPLDMTAIPADLGGFDFCWSICSLEHLGSLDEGLAFIERSVDTLAPGGIAIHTTEFNLSSDDETVESGPTVIYRKRDVLALRDRLEAKGHQVAALDFSEGDGILDRYVDVPPYGEEPVLRFLAGPYTLTSIAIVVRARPS
jgi:SAM-dependent methyltransferase